MNKESLDRLLVDRALGEACPELCELLDEYLAGNADAQRRAAEIRETVGLSRTAFEADLVPPCIGSAGVPPRERAGLGRFALFVAPALAACLLLGLAVGWIASRWSSDGMDEPRHLTETRWNFQPANDRRGGGFWSVSRVVAQARSSERTDATSRGISSEEIFRGRPLTDQNR